MIRNKNPFLEKADFEVLDINDKYLQFRRENEKEDALISVSRTGERSEIFIPRYYQDADTIYPLGDSNKFELDSHGGIVLKKTK
jgi:hypothetical protein